MPVVRPEELVRNFRENGLKLLLQEAGNVRDVLALTGRTLRGEPDFARLKVARTTYVTAAYRHLTNDIVLQLPYRTRAGGRKRTLTLCILIEHQSEPDALMIFRVLEYLVQIYKEQIREWRKRHAGSLAGFAFQPVLPIVLYTGSRRWDAIEALVTLVTGGEEFADVVPEFRPLFVNLPALAPEELEASGGAIGWVLALIQKRDADPHEYRALLARAVAHLERMAEEERDRWLLLLSYVQALVYHDRVAGEREELRELIVSSTRTDERRREVNAMTQTIAEALREEGLKKGVVDGVQKSLIHLLRAKFKKIPRAAEKIIQATDDTTQLNAWLSRVLTATTFDDMGIGTPRGH